MDWVTEQVAVSEYPSSKTDLLQFDGILNLDRYTPYKTDVRLEHMPLIDGPGNTPEAVADVLERMEAEDLLKWAAKFDGTICGEKFDTPIASTRPSRRS